jgi:muramoyltetrapeptide carboxypeptidase
MLLQLLQAGILGTQQAIIFGDFSSYQLSAHDAGYDLHSGIALLKSELLRMGSKTQVLHQLPFGHCRNKITLPIGVTGQISADQNGFILTSI